MGIGSSFKKTVGSVVSKLPGGDTRLGGTIYGAALGSLAGPLGIVGGATGGYMAGKYASEYKKPDGTPMTPEEIQAITNNSLFSRLSSTEQKDLLLNNPNVITPEGSQIYDPYTNTISLNESDYTKAQRLQQERLLQELASSLSGYLPSTDNETVRQATFDLGKKQLDPELQSQRQQLATQLANQGIPINSEAYNSAMNRLETSQGEQLNQLSLQSILAGIQTSESQRAARFNEISSLLGKSQVGAGINFGNYQSNYQGLDLMGAQQAELNRQAQINAARIDAKARANAAKWQAGGSVVGAGIGAAGMSGLFSDISLKENIHFENKIINNLPIYSFEYKNKSYGDGRFIGVMAQDVEKIYPEAVIINKNGFKMVNYSKIGIEFRRIQ